MSMDMMETAGGNRKADSKFGEIGGVFIGTSGGEWDNFAQGENTDEQW